MLSIKLEVKRTRKGIMRTLTKKIDRLSNLPNELLDSIFDFAYTLDDPPTGPLSKRLLPWFISGLYRRIKLEKESNIDKLETKIYSHPHLGAFVESLVLDPQETEFDWSPFGTLDQFFRNLTRLVELEFGADKIDTFDNLVKNGIQSISSDNLPSLRHLTIPGHFLLSPSASFSALVSLRIFDLDCGMNLSRFEQHDRFSNLCQLSVEGMYGDSDDVASICSSAPNLRSLSLKALRPDYNQVLSVLPATITTLELRQIEPENARPCDEGLSRFTQLEHLSLGDYLFSHQLPSYLAPLTALRTIELGYGKISANEFLPLISGPTRLPLLSRLKLDLVVTGKVGYRLSVEADGSVGGRWVPGDGRLTGGDWVVPEFETKADEGDFTYDSLKEFVRVAKEEGIEVAGSISEAFETFSSWILEIANLAVYRSFRDKDLRHVLNLQADHPRLCGRLPSLDFDSLDLTKLKIVKKNLPEEEWFSLSLEN